MEDNGTLLPGRQVRKRYGVTDQTLWRWLHDDKSKFPKPIRIQGRRYWRVAELQAWETSRQDGGAQ
jgi:predicted DNA-binding transcriptional regulator AlpA